MRTLRYWITLLPVLFTLCASAQTVDIHIDTQNPTVTLSPHLYGLFFEDINYAADGGLYAELVQNRSFEYYPVRGRGRRLTPLFSWNKIQPDGAQCEISVVDANPLNDNNTHYLKLDATEPGQGVGVYNTGFDGITLNADEPYRLSLYARTDNPAGTAGITVSLELDDGTVLAQTQFNGINNDWQKYETQITPSQSADNARLVIKTTDKGTLDLDMVSLFPTDTFAGRTNGMRKDLGQALKDLHPRFLRFPGGCVAHGNGLDNTYRWKDTIGDVAQRKPNWNRWGYHQSYGLGYYEYFQLCEDIGATPLPVVPVGVSCSFSHYECVPMDQLGEWIGDTLDLIEFANGPTDSKWGAVRAQMGHPEPFNLKLICLGNEEGDTPQLRERFPYFVKAIRDKYPDIKIVGTSGLGANIPLFDLMKQCKVYASDEHYYEDPIWFIQNQHRFDDFDRSDPKIFVGEYASRGSRLFNAVAEAAYLTGVERNGDIVDMTCYAPLLANVHHMQWRPDLIYFDNRNVVKTPSYYVQQLFAANKGDAYLANKATYKNLPEPKTPTGAVGVGTWRSAIEVQSIKVNGKTLNPSDWQTNGGDFKLTNGLYTQSDPAAEPAVSTSKISFDDDRIVYEVRARKTGGDEGFLIIFGDQNGKQYRWNVGGWGNRQNAIQLHQDGMDTVVAHAPGHVENDTWYDMRVVLTPGRIRCYLDNKLIHDYTIPHPSISIAAALDKQTGDVIVKLVNPNDQTVDATITLDGIVRVNPDAKLLILAGDKNAENTMENPDAVQTQSRPLQVDRTFNYQLPPTSVQFIRINTRPSR